MRFSKVIHELTGVIQTTGDNSVNGVEIDSRKIKPGDLFVCLKGSHFNAHDFIKEALNAGATAFIVTEMNAYQELKEKNTAVALVTDGTEACWRVCKKIYENPSKNLKIAAVTGTNGKTTVAWLLKQTIGILGQRSAYIGTLGAHIDNKPLKTELTTPFPPELNRLLKQMVQDKVTYVTMEASSHALSQKRIDGIEIDVAIFTNLTQDHLDYHPNIEEYFSAKRRLFLELEQDVLPHAVCNYDDPFGRRILAEVKNTLSYGTSYCDLIGKPTKISFDELQAEVTFGGITYHLKAPIGAAFNVLNCLAVIGTLITLGYDPKIAVESLSNINPPPGRFESIPTHSNYRVIVDYAHTPDALEKLLQSVKNLHPNRILTVFGCGGDRDKTKRPIMASVAEKYSDLIFLTSDNPRTEDPNQIINDAINGIQNNNIVIVDPNRRTSIFNAIENAQDADVVVIAGKGHENYQIIGNVKEHFDDRECAAEAIASKKS